MKIPRERFKDVSAIILSTQYIEVMQTKHVLDHELSNMYSEDVFDEFLSEYVEWRKEEKNKLKLEDGWYSALNYTGTRYSIYIKDNQQYTPWLGKDWKTNPFEPRKDDQYWSDYKKLPYGKLDEWEVADRFVTTLNERRSSYWEVLNDDCVAQ